MTILHGIGCILIVYLFCILFTKTILIIDALYNKGDIMGKFNFFIFIATLAIACFIDWSQYF